LYILTYLKCVRIVLTFNIQFLPLVFTADITIISVRLIFLFFYLYCPKRLLANGLACHTLVCVFYLVVCCRTLCNINVFCYIFAEGLKFCMVCDCVVFPHSAQKLPFFAGWCFFVSMWTSGVSYRQLLSSQVIWFQSNMQFILLYHTCSLFCAHQLFVEL